MRKVFTFLAAVLLTASVFAQSPAKMSYQAVVRDADGRLVINTKVGIKISIQKYILGLPPSFKDVYVETHSIYSTNENGLLTVIIGSGKTESGNFGEINWGDGQYYINTEIDPGGGTNYTIDGRSPLLSVPYALHAKNAKTYKVGDFAQGGIVFWVDKTGHHGLVAAKEDQSTGVRWYAGTFGVTRATGDGPFSGELNTSIIISSQVSIGDDGSDYAAQICNDLQITEGGKTYGDWYLPSKEELNLMYQNKAAIDTTAGANGGSPFASKGYWSSTENSSGYSWVQAFNSYGYQNYVFKYDEHRVRAIRAF